MPWYRVTKKIKGRLYDYWQRTYRVGKSVKTENRYIGPSHKGDSVATATGATVREPLYAGQFEIPIAAISGAESGKPRNIRELKKLKRIIVLAPEFDHVAFAAVQDELDQAYAVKSDKEKKRASRARIKGIKSQNSFIAQALLRRP
jgi:hypothetical protein